jgi:deoxyribonuclease-4
MRLGVHVSISGSIDMAVDRAIERNCNTFQVFTRNPRGWKFNDLENDKVDKFLLKIKDSNINPVVDHMPYLPNLASPKNDVYEKSVMTLCEEVKRCGLLKIPYLVLHLGSHLGVGKKVGRERLTNAMEKALDLRVNGLMLLLENMAGSKNSMGSTFLDIAEIIDELGGDPTLGVCFDTCHAFATGYDLRTSEAVKDTIDKLDELIGVERLKVVHLNDSKGELGRGLDRHEHIGVGKIGDEGFKHILRHPVIKDKPLILETPIDQRGDDFKDLERTVKLYNEANYSSLK